MMAANVAGDAPSGIVLHMRSQRLELRWPDGTHQSIDAATLRASCPCSACESLRIRTGASCTAAGLRSIEAVGEYAIRIVFDDGHDRGIFPWTYLRGL
jgi:DUF971 family protein